MDAKGIARALREQLGSIGMDVSMAQALEVVAKTAGHRNWNTLLHIGGNKPAPVLAPATTNGIRFCPQCGKEHTVHSVSSAFVEQGEYFGNSYEYEGDADHYLCNDCGYQFLDWQSDYACKAALEEKGNQVLLGT